MIKLRPYQKEAVEIIANFYKVQKLKGFLLADEAGLGKGIQALFIIKKLLRYNQKGLIIIICPANMKLKWVEEIRKVLPKKRAYNIYVKSYNDLINPLNFRYFTKFQYDLCIIDEGHYVKDFDSLRTQAILGAPALQIKTVMDCSKYVLNLTATPFPNRVGEIYPWLWKIRHPLIRNRTEQDFIIQWATSYRMNPRGQLSHKGIKNPEKFRKAFKMGFLRRRRIEVAKDLPLGTRDFITIPLSTKMLKEEEELFREILELAGYKGMQLNILTNNPGLFQKLLEITPSFEKMTTFKRQQGLAKINAVVSYLLENVTTDQKKFILFTYHRDVATKYFEILSKKIKTPLGLITGDVPARERHYLVKKYDKMKEIILIASMTSVREGIDLIGFTQSYFTEIDWAPYVLEQVEGRTLRIGQKFPVFWNYFLFDKGFEKFIFDMVQDKQRTIKKILGA